MNMGRRSESNGYTLIEMLVVISIIIFLMGFVAVVALRRTHKGREEAARALLERISLALSLYEGTFHKYPPTDPNRSPEGYRNTANLYPYLMSRDLQGKGLPTFQSGELYRDGDQTRIVDPWGKEIVYYSPDPEMAMRRNFQLYSYGPDRKYGGGDDISLEKPNY